MRVIDGFFVRIRTPKLELSISVCSGFNNPTAYTDLIIIKNHRLTRRNGSLRLVKNSATAVIAYGLQSAGLICLPVAGFGGTVQRFWSRGYHCTSPTDWLPGCYAA